MFLECNANLAPLPDVIDAIRMIFVSNVDLATINQMVFASLAQMDASHAPIVQLAQVALPNTI
jgi:hypothetical protein